MRLHRGTKGITFGSAWMFKALIGMLKIINIRVLYGFMAICVIPVTLVLSPGARLTYRYYHKRLGYGMWKALGATLGCSGFCPIGNRDPQKIILKRPMTKSSLFLVKCFLFFNLSLNEK